MTKRNTEGNKTFFFKSKETKSLVESVGEVYADIYDTTPSMAVAKILEDAVLPQNNDAKDIAKELYSGQKSLYKAYESVFQKYCSGENFKAKYDNGIDLLEQLISDWDANSIEMNVEEAFSIASNYSEICKIIEKNLTSDHEEQLVVYESPVKYAKHFLNELVEEPEALVVFNLLDVVHMHWNLLGNNTCTYRMLAGLMRCERKGYVHSSSKKYKFVEVLKKISEDWN